MIADSIVVTDCGAYNSQDAERGAYTLLCNNLVAIYAFL